MNLFSYKQYTYAKEIIMSISPQEVLLGFQEWKVQEDGNGFYIYTKADFNGCIRQNSVDGAAEVFGKTSAEEIIANPLQSDPWFTEHHRIGSDGCEEFARAVLFIDIISNA